MNLSAILSRAPRTVARGPREVWPTTQPYPQQQTGSYTEHVLVQTKFVLSFQWHFLNASDHECQRCQTL